MSTALRVGAFALLLLVMAATGFVLGEAVGPIDVGGSAPSPHDGGHLAP